MSRTIRPTAKIPNRPPTISIGVICHLGRFQPCATASHRRERGHTGIHAHRGGGPIRHDYKPVWQGWKWNKNGTKLCQNGTRDLRAVMKALCVLEWPEGIQ